MQKMGMESCKQIFGQGNNLIKHLKVGRCTGVKTKIICSGGKFGHILNSSDKVFHGGDTKFSYTACQWIEAEFVKIGKHIHHKMCGHGGKRTVKIWVLDHKGEKTLAYFQLMVMNLRLTQYTSIIDVIVMDVLV